MRFGVTRKGPSAPLACQFGKKDTLTSTGVPIRDTWNRNDSGSARTADTAVAGTGTRGGDAAPEAAGRTRGQEAGPPAASSTGHAAGSSYHTSDTGSQLDWAWPTPSSTAGS